MAPRPIPPSYRERLYLPWWLWLAGLGLAGLLAAELHLGAPGLRAWLPYVLVLPPVPLIAWWLGRLTIRVVDDELWVDDARLPVGCIENVTPLETSARRDVLGIHAHPLAFIIQRPWITGTVLVTLNDPADPTPYWVVSTRRPAELAAVLRALGAALPGREAPTGQETPTGTGQEALCDGQAPTGRAVTPAP